MKKILLTTGGTGGHIYPALAVAKELKNQGLDLVFVGTKHRMETKLIPESGYKFYGLDILPLRSVSSIIKLFKGIFDSIKIIKNEEIDAVIGFGNYISLPSLIAAKILRKKIYLQEQNVSMGMANKLMYRFSDKIFLAFKESLENIPSKYHNKFIFTGNPLREEFYSINKYKAREELNIENDKKVICIMGGSLGARNINEAFIKNIEKISNDTLVYWSTGKDLYQETVDKVQKKDNIKILPYFENAHLIIAASDLMVCRAGASTISELIQLEKPSILIPYSFVGQMENAKILENINSAKIYTNENANKGIEIACNLIDNQEELNSMSNNIKIINPGNAVKNILQSVLKK